MVFPLPPLNPNDQTPPSFTLLFTYPDALGAKCTATLSLEALGLTPGGLPQGPKQFVFLTVPS